MKVRDTPGNRLQAPAHDYENRARFHNDRAVHGTDSNRTTAVGSNDDQQSQPGATAGVNASRPVQAHFPT